MKDKHYILTLFLIVVIVALVGSITIMLAGVEFSESIEKSNENFANGQAKVGLEIVDNTNFEEDYIDSTEIGSNANLNEFDISSCSSFCDNVCNSHYENPDDCLSGCLDGCLSMKERENLPDY
jgi:ABC-type antimicrobial peptide transport system permease subunit